MTSKTEKLRGGIDTLFGATAKPREEQEPANATDLLQDEELREALHRRRMEQRGRPRRGRPRSEESRNTGRITAIVNLSKWEKVKYISLQETMQIKEVLDIALDMVIGKYEAEKGEIRPTTPSKSGNVFNK